MRTPEHAQQTCLSFADTLYIKQYIRYDVSMEEYFYIESSRLSMMISPQNIDKAELIEFAESDDGKGLQV